VDIKPEFLQKYLDEFCYKFNRCYAGETLFARLPFACVSYKMNLGMHTGRHICFLTKAVSL